MRTTWSSTRCGWHSFITRRAATSRSFITATAARRTRAFNHTQTLADHGVLASLKSVGDAYDNALAKSVVNSFKSWRSRSQLELAVVEFIG